MGNTDIKGRLEALMERQNMDVPTAARYLGVPTYTFRKWLSGERTRPASATIRLLDVLGVIETLAPTIHDCLIER